MTRLRKKFTFVFVFNFLFIVFVLPFFTVFAQTPTETPTPTPSSSTAVCSSIPECSSQNLTCDQCVSYFKDKVSQSQSAGKTLSSQIQVMNNQIKLTEVHIGAAKQQLLDLATSIETATKKITKLEESLSNLTKILANRIVATYETGTADQLQILMVSSNFSDLLSRAQYLKIVQNHDKKLVFETQQAKNDYANQKNIFEDKKKKAESLKLQLETYNTQLDREKKSKQQLLTETKGSEANYQRLLSEAQAQVAALSGFAHSQFGPGVQIISHQDISDGWGKYYNQRDANWGNNLIGSSPEKIWEVGCLLTSYAMVVTHFGGSITPADVAGNSDNFSVSTAYFKKPGPSAGGHSVESRDNPSIQGLRDDLNSGAVIIAGLSADGGSYPKHYSDHWVVLRSVDGDSFRINDPLYQGAINVSLNDHYSGWTIIESRIYR